MADFPFDVVGFDLDGTLLDTAYDLGHALNHALSLAGRPTIPLEDVRGLIGGGTGQMLRGGLMRTGGIDEAELPGLTEAGWSRSTRTTSRATPRSIPAAKPCCPTSNRVA
jgi:phosphoglycolate phosphatase